MTPPKARAPAPLVPPSSALAVAKIASPARSLSAARGRRRSEALKGNARAFSHGIMAIVANQADTATEVALTYASHPDLDPIADLRLVESYCLAAVQYRRSIVAIYRDGMTPVLTAYSTRLAALVERLEAKVHERERERIHEMRRGDSMIIQLQARPTP